MSVALSQFAAEQGALRKLKKQKWEDARKQLEKAIHRDSVNAGARYAMALYFFETRNPVSNIDSAYRFVTDALTDYLTLTGKQKSRLRKIPLDSATLIHLRNNLDSVAFHRAWEINSEYSYIHFLNSFPFARERQQALELRDESAYRNAVTENTHQAFAQFLEKYPHATQASEASQRYEELLFAFRTHDKHISSYESFLQDFPQSPYRNQVEKQIFELLTFSGHASAYVNFIKKYPASTFNKKANDILYHLLEDPETDTIFLDHITMDSLQEVGQRNKGYLVPFLKNGMFGFMDQYGREIVAPVNAEISKEYLCGNIVEDVLVLSNKIIGRNGAIVFQGVVQELDDIGAGFLKINVSGCIQVVHKSGFVFREGCYEDALTLARRFLSLKKDNGWQLYTLSGRLVSDDSWDDVKEVTGVISVKKNGYWQFIMPEDISSVTAKNKLNLSEGYEEVKVWSDKLIWVRQATKEGLLDSQLNSAIPIEEHILKPDFFGVCATSSQGMKIYYTPSGESDYFQKINAVKPWVSIKHMNSWKLFDPLQRKIISENYDTIGFVGLFAVGYHGDSITVFINNNRSLNFYQVKVGFISGNDSTFYLLVTEGDKKSIFDSEAKKLFSVSYDNVQYAEGGIFIVSKKEKKGLIDSLGKLLLSVEMDAIGNQSGNLVPVLKGMKFGLFDIANKLHIKPTYDKNLVPYADRYILAFKNGKYGFITWQNKPHTEFEYSDVRPWSNTVALVKKNAQWMLMDVSSKEIVMDNIKEIKIVSETGSEKIAIVHQNDSYGVISNTRGIIIPLNFSDIINIGSTENPLYFTEKHVEEASLFVVIYYDEHGKMIYRQAFEADDYERIYCSRN